MTAVEPAASAPVLLAMRALGDFQGARFATDAHGLSVEPASGLRVAREGLMICVTLGHGAVSVDKVVLTLARGDVLVFDPADLETLRTDRPTSWISLVVPRSVLMDGIAGAPDFEPLVLPRAIVSAAHLRACLLCLWRRSDVEPLPGLADAIVDLLLVAIDHLASRPEATGLERIRQLRRVAKLIREGLTDPDFDVGALSRQAGLAPRDLAQLLSPLRPSEVIRNARLSIAKRTLSAASSARLSIADVGRRVGMTNLAHFSSRYRRTFGAPPGAARRPC